MAGQTGLHGNFRGLAVADFADHDNIGILPQNRPQTLGESHFHFGVNLGLADAVQIKFDGVFHRQNIARAFVQPVDYGVQTGGFTGTGRAGHQDNAVRVRDHFLNRIQLGIGHADLFEIELVGLFVQQPQHDPFAMTGRQRGHPHVHGTTADIQ